MKRKSVFYSMIFFVLLSIILLYFKPYLKAKSLEKKTRDLHSKDILIFKNDNSKYTFAKIDTIIGEVILFRNSRFSIDQLPTQSIYKKAIKQEPELFDYEIVYYNKNELDSLRKIEKLVAVLPQ